MNFIIFFSFEIARETDLLEEKIDNDNMLQTIHLLTIKLKYNEKKISQSL